jgi:hypothetical protein
MRARSFIVIAAGLALLPQSAPAQKSTQAGNGRWVSTWATAQQLQPPPVGGFGGRGPGPGPQAAPNVPRPPQGPPQGTRPNPNRTNLPATLVDQTIRMPIRVSVGGAQVRIEISNMVGAQPLEVGAAHIAAYQGKGSIAAGTDRALTFGGSASVIVPPGTLAVSDAVNLSVAPLSDLAISLYLPRDTGAPTTHNVGLTRPTFPRAM